MFCSMTGAYLPAPYKKRKTVTSIGLGMAKQGGVTLDRNGEIYFAALIRLVLNSPNLVVVETKNSVYVGKPM